MQKKSPAAPGSVEFLRENPIFFSLLGGVGRFASQGADGNVVISPEVEKMAPHLRYNREFRQTGVKLYSTPLDSGWVAPDTYDYTRVDYTLKCFFDTVPDGYLLPRILADVPVEWCRQNPEEVFLYVAGKGLSRDEVRERVATAKHECNFFDLPDDHPGIEALRAMPYKELATGAQLRLQSLSSTVWMQDAAEALRRLIAHIEASPYADRIAGYHLGFGNTGECLQWFKYFSDPYHYVDLGDYGISHLRRFYDYGLAKYGSREALAKAWQQPNITRDTVDLPTPTERYGGARSIHSFFRGDKKDTICTDMDAFLSQNVADAIEVLADAAKQITKKAVGFFYGYFIGPWEAQYHGHLQVERVWSNPNVDFFCAPTAYHFRGVGEPSLDMSPTQSVNRKKLWIEELDARTYLVDPARADARAENLTANMEETRYVLWRHLCKNLAHHSGFWWMDLGGGWYDAPDIMAEIDLLKKAHDTLKEGDHTSEADVLFVVDPAGMEHVRMNRNYTLRFVRDTVRMARSAGVQCDLYHICDLPELDLSRYRLVAFILNYTLTPAQLAALPLAKDATLMFNFTTGILQNGSPSLEGVKALTGFTLVDSYDEARDIPLCRIVGEDSPLLVTKVVNGRRHVMNANEQLTPDEFRAIAREAGCHIYTDVNAVIFGDKSFIGVFSKGETHTVLHLNGKARCEDIRTGKVYEGEELPLDLMENEFIILKYKN